MKLYNIVLTEEDIDNLTYDYSCVEGVIERILKQAKQEGYLDPEERLNSDEGTDSIKLMVKKLKKLTKEYLTARIIQFEKQFMDYTLGEKITDPTMINELNQLFIDRFGEGKVNTVMFTFQNYDCRIALKHITKTLYVEFNSRRKRIFTPQEKDRLIKKYGNTEGVKEAINKYELAHSHNIPFVDFCNQHCNPWIISELEKILFKFI